MDSLYKKIAVLLFSTQKVCKSPHMYGPVCMYVRMHVGLPPLACDAHTHVRVYTYTCIYTHGRKARRARCAPGGGPCK